MNIKTSNGRTNHHGWQGLAQQGRGRLATRGMGALLALMTVQAGALAGEPLITKGFKVNAGDGTIVQEVIVKATPEQVWTAWTTEKGLKSFFAKDARVELRIGGAYELYFLRQGVEGARGSEGCTILSYLPYEMLSFTWNAPPSIPTIRDQRILTYVVLTFDDLGDGQIKVRLAHLGLGAGDDWDKYRTYFERAWTHVLKQLTENVGSIEPDTSTGPDPRLRFELTVDASLERVWEAFATKAGIESWMVPKGDIDVRVGGLMRTTYNREGSLDDSGAIANRILTVEPNRLLAYQLVKCPDGFPHAEAAKGTWSVLRLEPVGKQRTRVVLTGAGLGEGPHVDQMVQFFQAGNQWTLDQLRKKFAAE